MWPPFCLWGSGYPLTWPSIGQGSSEVPGVTWVKGSVDEIPKRENIENYKKKKKKFWDNVTKNEDKI